MKTFIVFVFVGPVNSTGVGWGVNLQWFLVRTCGLCPRTPLSKVKKHTHSYTSHSDNCTHSYTIFQILPIHILRYFSNFTHSYTTVFFKFYPFIYFLGETDTPLIYFWSENDTHSYTWRPDNMMGLVQTSSEATWSWFSYPLRMSWASFSPWTWARVQVYGEQTTFSNAVWYFLNYFIPPPDRPNDQVILFLSCLVIGLSVNCNLCYNFWTVRNWDFIFCMRIPLIMPLQMTPRPVSVSPWLWRAFSLNSLNLLQTVLPLGHRVSHTHLVTYVLPYMLVFFSLVPLQLAVDFRSLCGWFFFTNFEICVLLITRLLWGMGVLDRKPVNNIPIEWL